MQERTQTMSITASKIESLEPPTPPELDTAYSWLMATAGFFIQFIIFGSVSIFGVYLAHYSTHEFANESKSLLSLVGGVGPAIYALCSLPSGILAAKVGPRVNIIAGGVIFGVGYLIASFATHVWMLFLGQAVFVGIGVSLSFIPTISIVPQWFSKYRGLAVGICAAGSGIGGLVLAPVIQAIIDSIGIRWALRINAIVGTVVVVAGGLIIKPRVPFQRPKKVFETDIITNPKFLALWGMGLTSCFAYFVPFFIMPLYCAYYGISPSTASLIVGLMNGASAIGRIVTGQVSNIFGNVNTLFVCNLVTSLSLVVIWHFATNTWSLIVFAIVYGIFSGGFFSISALIAPQLFGMDKLAKVNGPFYTCSAPGYMLGSVIATALVNQYTTGDYVNYLPAQFYLFGCYILSCLSLIWLKYQLTSSIFERA